MNTTKTETELETETLIRLETRSQELRRRGLESEFAHATLSGDEMLVRAIRRQIGLCDRKLMELAAGPPAQVVEHRGELGERPRSPGPTGGLTMQIVYRVRSTDAAGYLLDDYVAKSLRGMRGFAAAARYVHGPAARVRCSITYVAARS